MITKLIRDMIAYVDHWKCQCMMINRFAIWLDNHKVFEKSLQIVATIVSFLNLILSVLTLNGKQQIQMYFPVHGHYLLSYNEFDKLGPTDKISDQCHYFNDLRLVKFVGFNTMTFFRIRIVILFLLFMTDMLGLFFAFVHPPCGTKMYVFGLTVTLFFFVLFPGQLCINFGSKCIQYSPIFQIYRIQFMIERNVAWLGIGSILLIIFVIPLVSYISQNHNTCGLGRMFYEIIYGMVLIPYVTIASINFITALWTSSALINIITFIGLVINYLLYHAGTDIQEQYEMKEREIQRLVNQQLERNQRKSKPLNEIDFQFEEEFSITNDLGVGDFAFVQSIQKPDRMKFYKQWQDRLYQEFHQT